MLQLWQDLTPMSLDGATLCSGALQIGETSRARLLSPDGLLDDLPQGPNLAELARRKFREIARVAVAAAVAAGPRVRSTVANV